MRRFVLAAMLAALLSACAAPATVDSPRPFKASPGQVRQAQMVLAGKGYWPGGIDGVLRAVTINAIRKYQADNGLEESGDLDEATLRSMKIIE